MKKTSIKLAIVVSFCAISFATFANNLPPSSDLQVWIEAQMHANHIPGASIALIKNYQIEWARGFGLKNKAKKERVTGNTLFQAASISKPVTALAAMKTFEQKKLSLDSDINTLLTSWKIPTNSYTTDQPVTMRLLLSHAAGITDFRYKGYATNTKLPALSEELLGKAPANTPAIVVVKKPGIKYAYSSAGYTIVQQVLTDLYKQPFDKTMEQLVLNPLRMKHSTFAEPLPQKYQSDIALPYLPNGKLMPNAPLIFVASAAGGLWSTPTDLAKFIIALQEALRGHPQNGITQPMVETILKPSINPHMGLGFEINLNHYGKPVKKGGNYFMYGGFNSGYLAIFLASKTNGNGIVIMVNSAPYMSAKQVPQYNFLTHVLKHIAKLENWQ
jgi:CubicO group peptidase (beta-lactamase class C family)